MQCPTRNWGGTLLRTLGASLAQCSSWVVQCLGHSGGFCTSAQFSIKDSEYVRVFIDIPYFLFRHCIPERRTLRVKRCMINTSSQKVKRAFNL